MSMQWSSIELPPRPSRLPSPPLHSICQNHFHFDRAINISPLLSSHVRDADDDNDDDDQSGFEGRTVCKSLKFPPPDRLHESGSVRRRRGVVTEVASKEVIALCKSRLGEKGDRQTRCRVGCSGEILGLYAYGEPLFSCIVPLLTHKRCLISRIVFER